MASPSNPPEVEKERRKEASGNARSGLGPPQRSRGSGRRPCPGESPTPPALARGRDPREERPAAGDPDRGVHRRRHRRRSGRASPGAIGYRFSCLSLGAPGEQGLHRPVGAPASIAPLSPPQRGEGGWRQVGPAKPERDGGGTTPPQEPRAEGGAGARLPPASPSGVVPNPCLWSSTAKFRLVVSPPLATLGTIIKTRRGRGYHGVKGAGTGPFREPGEGTPLSCLPVTTRRDPAGPSGSLPVTTGLRLRGPLFLPRH